MRNQSTAINRRLTDIDFVRDLSRKGLMVIVVQSIAIAVLMGNLLWTGHHPSVNHYFYTDGKGTPREVQPLDEPVMSDADLTTWTANSVVAAFSLDFRHFPKQMADAAQHFSVRGWNNYGAAFITSGNFDKLKQARLVMSAVPERAPIIHNRGLIGNTFEFEVQFPLLVTYENENSTMNQHLMVTVRVVRTPDPMHPDGIMIDQINLPPV